MIKDKQLFRSTAIKGFSTLIVREFLLKALSFLGQILLARLLFPEDFGVYAIIVFIVSFAGLFTDVGFSLAIIQKKKEVLHRELSNIFIFKMILACILVFIIWSFADISTIFYKSFSQQNVLMLKIFSLTLLFLNLKSIPTAILERNLKYNVISLVDIVGVVTYYLTTLLLAFLKFGVWSFIAGSLVKEISESILLYFAKPFMPTFEFNLKSIKKMMSFGVYLQFNSILMFLIGAVIPIIGAKAGGTRAVGILDFSNKLASFPGIVAQNFSRVAFATYSRIQDDKELLFRSIVKSINMLAIVLYIFPVIIFSFGYELVMQIYTNRWIDAVPILYWFSAAVFFYPVITAVGQVILAIGKSKEVFRTTLLTTFLGWGMALVLIQYYGFVGIAMAHVLIYFGLFVSYLYIIKKSGFNVFKFTFTVVPKIIVAFTTIIFSLVLNTFLPQGFSYLIIKLLFAFSSYLFLMFLLARRDTVELIGITKNLILKRYD